MRCRRLSVCDAVRNPGLLRLPEDEVEDPLPFAAVLVDSDEEWDRSVAPLFKRGLVAPADEAETGRTGWNLGGSSG